MADSEALIRRLRERIGEYERLIQQTGLVDMRSVDLLLVMHLLERLIDGDLP
jgi:hypothetical protein